jgi:hypothetical protein
MPVEPGIQRVPLARACNDPTAGRSLMLSDRTNVGEGTTRNEHRTRCALPVRACFPGGPLDAPANPRSRDLRAVAHPGVLLLNAAGRCPCSEARGCQAADDIGAGLYAIRRVDHAAIDLHLWHGDEKVSVHAEFLAGGSKRFGINVGRRR